MDLNKRLVRLKAGDSIPENAKFVHAESVDEFDGYEYFSREGLFITTDYKRAKYKKVTYLWYEVENCESRENQWTKY
jgi:hypothetical protein